ncbi:hypothetical protein EYF80_064547 [Liparis tanakae]|uniref:Uncharacterized protein n=1 Tax=Liparis tanakae TaxID=230148 RepID=A0A4Z2E985_9TELE|nr:hypothetical protein EYF80_064547 [Liparis tanakae]
MYYDEQYKDKDMHGFVRKEAINSGLTFKGSSLVMKATMSPEGRSMLKVQVWEKSEED